MVKTELLTQSLDLSGKYKNTQRKNICCFLTRFPNIYYWLSLETRYWASQTQVPVSPVIPMSLNRNLTYLELKWYLTRVKTNS